MLDWTFVVVSVVLDASLRATLLAGGVFLLVSLFAVRSPHVRHTVWLGVLLAMLVMPGLRLLLPDVPVSLGSWPAVSAGPGSAVTSSLQWATDNGTTDGEAALAPPVTGDTQRIPEASAPLWLAALATSYLAGVLFFGLKLVRGWAGAARVTHSARRVHDLAGAESFPVFESAHVVTPVTTGILHPRILLPASWRSWTGDRVRAVLAHEAAHAARRDPLAALLARINHAVFWFHPVAWWLERALSASAEEACDTAGIQAVGRREHYAEVLLEFARDVQRHGGRLGWHGSGVAGHGSLMQRIERVLVHDGAPRASRRRIVAAGTSCLAAACVVAAVEAQVTAGASDGVTTASGGVRPELSQPSVRLAEPVVTALPVPAGAPPVPAHATQGQATLGSIEGVVLDPSGLPISNVEVTLFSETNVAFENSQQTGHLVLSGSTDARGRYAFYNVTLGTYRLRVQLPGFKTLTRNEVTVKPGLQTLAPVVLQVGGVAETVEVRREASGAGRSGSHASSPVERTSGEEAERLAAVAASPDDPKPHLELARFYDGAGRPADAERVSRRAQELIRARQAASAVAAPQTGGDITPPLKVRDVRPVFPPVAGSGGVVILEATIGTDGQIQNAKVLRGVRDAPAFDQAALSALEQWLFTPALLNGSPVEVVVTVTMNFTAR